MIDIADRNVDVIASQLTALSGTTTIMPNKCQECDQLSEYGFNGKWYCTEHWISLK